MARNSGAALEPSCSGCASCGNPEARGESYLIVDGIIGTALCGSIRWDEGAATGGAAAAGVGAGVGAGVAGVSIFTGVTLAGVAFGIGVLGRSPFGAWMRVPEVIRAIATDKGTGR